MLYTIIYIIAIYSGMYLTLHDMYHTYLPCYTNDIANAIYHVTLHAIYPCYIASYISVVYNNKYTMRCLLYTISHVPLSNHSM
jgi:hypothetical protein